jgi:hemoglobin
MSERKNPYEMIGGAAKIEELVDRFYDVMALEESFEALRAVHPPRSIELPRKAQTLFVGLAGRPRYLLPQAWSSNATCKTSTLQDWYHRT